MSQYLFDFRNCNSDELEKIKQLLKNVKVVAIDFYADWCGPCKKLTAELERIIPQCSFSDNIITPDKYIKGSIYSDKIAIIKINIDEYGDMAELFNVDKIPHVAFYKNGNLQDPIVSSCGDVLLKLRELFNSR